MPKSPCDVAADVDDFSDLSPCNLPPEELVMREPEEREPVRVSTWMPRQPTPEEQEARKKRDAARRRRETIEHYEKMLITAIGPRYANATLDNYEASEPMQFKALAAMRSYAASMPENVRLGRGIVLFGKPGTGKDHLLAGLMRVAIQTGNGRQLRWVNGMDLYTSARARINNNSDEEGFLERYTDPRVLVLSDPLPPSGPLTPFQASLLFQILDRRYRDLKPVWLTMNVGSAEEANERLGAAVLDRLKDTAIVMYCGWTSYRKPMR